MSPPFFSDVQKKKFIGHLQPLHRDPFMKSEYRTSDIVKMCKVHINYTGKKLKTYIPQNKSTLSLYIVLRANYF